LNAPIDVRWRNSTTTNVNSDINRTPSFFTNTIYNTPSIGASDFTTNSYSLTTALNQ